MRKIENLQLQLGECDISQIKFNPKSRDDIPKILRGIQEIYVNPQTRSQVFEILEKIVPAKVNAKDGRPGMNLWRILVLGVLRLGINCDYDRILELSNEHKTLREMLGHGGAYDDGEKYNLQTIKDNVLLLTPEIVDEISEVVVNQGHKLVKKKEAKLKGRCDSFVVETNVHFPTDISLLFDSIRKVITLTASLSQRHGLTEWRQSSYNLRSIKLLRRKIQQLKRSRSKDPEKMKVRESEIKAAHADYINLVSNNIEKADKTVASLGNEHNAKKKVLAEIEKFLTHARRQVNQIHRRVIGGESIPHDEKVFSVFEEHTEWVSKGKAGVLVELGLKVCVMEDHHGYILDHHVMQNQSDNDIAVSMVESSKKKFPSLCLVSFDKGFHSPSNQEKLAMLLDMVVLPKKGRLNKAEKEREHSEEFMKARRQHSAVESAINGLESHGLDHCPDHGLTGFKRYVSLAVLTRNLHRFGGKLIELEQRHKKRLKKAA